ncbi:AAA family ATPase [Rhodopseudomonas sp. P2A-2r]|uniref:ATP-binding protein n=1 Tax=Rhodopseudomonas sp. P2A-2r TaxID=2991972 RepID=UPI002234D7BE|nr:YhaN family protein [Rhodopseudomonas sp. P2A-2r]UZE50580.1 AAA family ATPase [Rhodopseudomonas sp. P2A-2r]
MRIERLTLERYGALTDRALAFRPDASLHVVLGANEAGKTSALSAITDLLFGFGGRTDYDFRHDSKTLRIGGDLRHSDGRTLSVRRRKGNKNTLVDGNDQPLPDDCLAPFLDGVLRDTFSREFGLTALALRQGGHDLLAAGGSLAETLAAGSAGMTALSRLRERLKTEADELFTPRKSASKPFYLAADRLDAADKALRDAVVTREALEAAEAAVQEARQYLAALTADHAATGRNLARLQRTQRVRSKLARLQALGDALTELADLPIVPATKVESWRAALTADAAVAGEVAALDAAAATDANTIATMAVDDGLLSAGAAIDALRERLGAVRKAMEDLPRRREAHRAAQETLNAAAHRLGLPSHTELLHRLPTDAALALVRDLIDRLQGAERSQRDAEEKRARALHELQSFTSDDAVAHKVTDPEPLRQRLEALADIPTHADRLHRAAAALQIERKNVATAHAALDPPAGDLDGLAALPIPDPAVIAAHAQAAELGDKEIGRLADLVDSTTDVIEAAEIDLARLSNDGAVSTRADLQDARQDRDVRLQHLRGALDGEAAVRNARLADLESATKAIDIITDRLLTDTERAARREALQERLEQSRREHDRIKAARDGLRARRIEAEAAWRSIWTASGIIPRSPADMARWQERVSEIVRRQTALDVQQADFDALSESQAAKKAGVMVLLESMGRTPQHALPAEILFREAKSRLDELQKGWADARERAVARQRAERDLAEADAALARATQARGELAGLWPAALKPIGGLAASASPAEAEAALIVWQSVAVPKLNWESEGHRVASIEADLAAFDRDVADVMRRVAPDLNGADPQQVLAGLADRLSKMRMAADACQRLRDAGVKRGDSRAALLLKRSSIETVLRDACTALGAADAAMLVVPLDRLTMRHALETEREALRRDLLEVADGLDEDALRAEQAGLDVDLLPGDIDRETMRLEQLLDQMKAVSAQLHQRERETEVLIRGRDAASAAAERAEAGAELVAISERWLLRSAAARLAAIAIERHRALVQDPLIARASELFALATGAMFAGLGVDYGNDDQPVLVAARTDNERVPVAGLSEGTRDQLFLALRLALLERRAGEALPFIGDDLLTSFDETRTAASLQLLASVGRQRQVIIFTHHRHVVELAEGMPDHLVDVVRLEQIAG